MITERPKPMTPVDRRIRAASAGLRDARLCGNKNDIAIWTAKLDEALDAKLADNQTQEVDTWH